ncbi:MAG TPA: phosphoribosylformylglycinamidine cyclo-ligase [Longimicrobiales bacterium]|nr:phosphoribosylformylglycinamidine cyclo-ligase [Longimicrobiales bacterium]
MESTGSGLSYRDAGVDRDAGGRAKRRIVEHVRSTASASVVSEPGSFGGLFRVPTGYSSPVLVSSADGVGTKIKVAMRAGRHDTVGEDLVNHCVNDILVEGAKPLFFLDYIGIGDIEEEVVEALVAGVARGCRANGCALIGGETAQMPDIYSPGEYDLAGFIVGILDEPKRLGAQLVRPGDRLIGLASSGFHTNGYSLLRRLFFDQMGLDVGDPYPGLDATVGDVLLTVHRSYLPALGPIVESGQVHALAHITGGGIPENLARVIPDGLTARVDRGTWRPPAEFVAVMEHGRVDAEEMFQTFNMGVGMIAVVAPEHAAHVLEALNAAGERAWFAGEVVEGARRVELT